MSLHELLLQKLFFEQLAVSAPVSAAADAVARMRKSLPILELSAWMANL